MNNRIIENSEDAKYGRLQQACDRYNVGKATMRKLAEQSGAVARIGRCYLINYSKVDAWLDQANN